MCFHVHLCRHHHHRRHDVHRYSARHQQVGRIFMDISQWQLRRNFAQLQQLTLTPPTKPHTPYIQVKTLF